MRDKTPFAQRRIADVADALPQSIDVFEEVGIDYSCKGLRSMSDAATAAGLTPEELEKLIDACAVPGIAIHWFDRPLEELTQFLARDHRDVATHGIPALRLAIFAAGERYPALPGLRRLSALFATFSAQVMVHMAHEERDLFDNLSAADKPTRDAAKNRLSQRVLREFVEHESFGEQLRTMREICLRLPAKCRGDLLGELDRFSRSVNFHIHLENNVLYPRAIEIENQLQHAS